MTKSSKKCCIFWLFLAVLKVRWNSTQCPKMAKLLLYWPFYLQFFSHFRCFWPFQNIFEMILNTLVTIFESSCEFFRVKMSKNDFKNQKINILRHSGKKSKKMAHFFLTKLARNLKQFANYLDYEALWNKNDMVYCVLTFKNVSKLASKFHSEKLKHTFSHVDQLMEKILSPTFSRS